MKLVLIRIYLFIYYLLEINIIVLQLSSIYYLNTRFDRPLIEINSLKLFWPS